MGNWFPVGKDGAKTSYTNKALCEAAEGQSCYDITGMDLRHVTIVDDAVVEDQDAKARQVAVDEINKEAAKQYDLNGIGIHRFFNGIRTHLENLISQKTIYCVKAMGKFTSVAGSTAQNISVPGVTGAGVAFAMIEEAGAVPVLIEKVECQKDNILVTMSADPSNDHVLTYIIIER